MDDLSVRVDPPFHAPPWMFDLDGCNQDLLIDSVSMNGMIKMIVMNLYEISSCRKRSGNLTPRFLKQLSQLVTASSNTYNPIRAQGEAACIDCIDKISKDESS